MIICKRWISSVLVSFLSTALKQTTEKVLPESQHGGVVKRISLIACTREIWGKGVKGRVTRIQVKLFFRAAAAVFKVRPSLLEDREVGQGRVRASGGQLFTPFDFSETDDPTPRWLRNNGHERVGRHFSVRDRRIGRGCFRKRGG